MAVLITDITALPDHPAAIPGANPPVTHLPYQDAPGNPEELDRFLSFIRSVRRLDASTGK